MKKFLNGINIDIFSSMSWYTVSTFLSSGVSYLGILLFTRIMSPSDFGIYSLFTAWLGIFVTIISFNLDSSLARAKVDLEDSLESFIASIATFAFLISSILLSIMLFTVEFMIDITGLQKKILIILVIVSFFKFVENIFILKSKLEFRYRRVAIYVVFSSIIGIAASYMFMINFTTFEKYLSRILGSSILTLTFGFIYFFILLKKNIRKIKFHYLKFGLLISLPFLLHTLFGAINDQIDRVIINQYLGSSAVGFYSFAYSIGSIFSIFVYSFNSSFLPIFLEKMKLNDYSSLVYQMRFFVRVFTLILVFMVLLSPELTKLVASESFWPSYKIIPMIILGNYFVFLYFFETNLQYFHKVNKFIPIGSVSAGLLNLLLNIIVIPLFGYPGAAFTTLISYLYLLLFHIFINSIVLKIDIFPLNKYIKNIVLSLFLLIAHYIFIDYIIIRIILLIIISILNINIMYKEKSYLDS